MDDFAANRWAKAAIERWKNADMKRSYVQLAEEMNARIPGGRLTKQSINKIKHTPEDGGGKPRQLKPAEIQALEAITGVAAPVLVQTLPAAVNRDMLRRAVVLVRAVDGVLQRAGIADDEWAEIAEGYRPFSRALADQVARAAGVPPEFVIDGDWECLPPAISKKMAMLATQIVPI
ncbi:MAG: hypothetical protein OJJ21_16695 [Ferrovibrio sp.]|uniref:hypothetical protein n=1 Tax=Ferrovibrio sp. TaxID=1917215 RepID=UPI002610BEBC|nr:hypothetical protein [Ferrovibrio sp.]MCW0235241.1 hypothetical protein [Ferrovibrio sp.]